MKSLENESKVRRIFQAESSSRNFIEGEGIFSEDGMSQRNFKGEWNLFSGGRPFHGGVSYEGRRFFYGR